MIAVALLVGACGNDDTSGTAELSSTTITTTTTADVTTTIAGPGAELVGVWKTTVPGPPPAAVTLNLRGDTYSIQREHGVGSGRYSVEGNQIEFAVNPNCEAAATYTWSLDGDALTFTSVTKDLCGRVTVLDGVTYTRAE